jgi:hypothetical protein
MGKGGGGSAPAPSTQTVQQTNLPAWAQPYSERVLGQAEALTDVNTNPYQQYTGQRVADFTPMQQQSFQNIQGMQPNAATGAGIDVAANAARQASQYGAYQPQQFGNQFQGQNFNNMGLGYLATQNPSLQNFQMQGPQNVRGAQTQAAQLNAAPMFAGTQFQGPQNVGAERVGTQDFTNPATAQSYMNPYMQNVVDIQQREAQRQADISKLGRNAQAVGAGAFGGSRQAIQNAEAARNLAIQKGDIQAQGLNTAYNQAQQAFQADQARQLQAQQANQQTGLQAGLANQQMGYNTNLQNAQLGQQAGLANQALAGQYGLQQGQFNQAANLANQQMRQQANLANQQMGYNVGNTNLQALLGVQQLGSGQNLQSQLANQQAYGQMQGLGMQQNLAGNQQAMQNAQLAAQYGLAGQQAGEQSRQFGANLGLQGLQQQLAAAGQLGQLGQQQYGQQMGINTAQQQAGAQQQAMNQQNLTNQYQDYLNKANYPYQQLSYMSDILHGTPTGGITTAQTAQAAPSMFSQISGALGGIGSLAGAYNAANRPYKEGGAVKNFAEGGSVVDEINSGNPDFASPSVAYGIKGATKLAKQGTPSPLSPDLAKLLGLNALLEKMNTPAAAKPNTTVMQDVEQLAQAAKATQDQQNAGVAGLPAPVLDQQGSFANGGIIAFDGTDPEVGSQVPKPKGRYDYEDYYGRRTPGVGFNEVGPGMGVSDKLGALFSGIGGLFGGEPKPSVSPEEAGRMATAPTVVPSGQNRRQAPPAADNRLNFPVSLKTPPATAPTTTAAATNSSALIQKEIDDLRKQRDARQKQLESAMGAQPETLTAEDAQTRAREQRTAALREAGLPETSYKDRIAELAKQGEQARADRDVDRWLGVAQGFFTMAAGKSPYAVQNIAAGLGVSTEQLRNANKEYIKAEEARKDRMALLQESHRKEVLGDVSAGRELHKEAVRRGEDYSKAKMTMLGHLASGDDAALARLTAAYNANEIKREIAKGAASNASMFKQQALDQKQQQIFEAQKNGIAKRRDLFLKDAQLDSSLGQLIRRANSNDPEKSAEARANPAYIKYVKTLRDLDNEEIALQDRITNTLSGNDFSGFRVNKVIPGKK